MGVLAPRRTASSRLACAWELMKQPNFAENLATVQEETSSQKEDLRLLKRAGKNAGVESQSRSMFHVKTDLSS